MKLGRSWQAQRGERGFPKLLGSMFCILGLAEGFTGHKSAFARDNILQRERPVWLGLPPNFASAISLSLYASLSLAPRYQRTASVTKASLCVQQVAFPRAQREQTHRWAQTIQTPPSTIDKPEHFPARYSQTPHTQQQSLDLYIHFRTCTHAMQQALVSCLAWNSHVRICSLDKLG